MDLFTLTLNKEATVPPFGHPVSRFEKQNVIDRYESLIWTERYYGDSEVQLVVPVSMDMIEKLPLGIFLGMSESDEIMMVETINITPDKKMTVQGISLLSWLNNRFVRTSKFHKIRSWEIEDQLPGQILWTMIENCVDAAFLSSVTTDIHPHFIDKLAIPEIGLHDVDMTGDLVTVKVTFGPLYDELRKIAETYQVGMQMLLETNIDPTVEQPLGFRSYTGLDRTSSGDNPIVRFSEEFDSFTSISELLSKSKYKTIAFAYASGIDLDLGDPDHGEHNAGVGYPLGLGGFILPDPAMGFDCRAVQVFADDLTGYPEPISNIQIRRLIKLLCSAARKELRDDTLIHAIDGDIVSTDMFQYGRDYGLGDIVEIQGNNTDFIKTALVTEYIRVEDENGERAYPTVTTIEDVTPLTSPEVDYLAPDPINANDNVGEAEEITGDEGALTTTNIDCTTDGVVGLSNTDWLVHEYGEPTGDLNWHTMWFKWAVPTGRWVDGESVFSAFLTDYDTHMVLFLCTPHVGTIPVSGPPADGDSYQTLGGDSTGVDKKPPYDMLAKFVDVNWWASPGIYEDWIYIGVATPHIDKLNNKVENHGGRFTLKWIFTE